MKAVARVGDPGYRDGVDGQERYDPASYIRKRAERFQMGHTDRQEIAGGPMRQELPDTFLLCQPPRKIRRHLSPFAAQDALDQKLYRLAYPRDCRNVPYRPSVPWI